MNQMKPARLILALLLLFGLSPARALEPAPDVFWLDRYGYISWEDEKARLDNFAIQLMNDPDQIGYMYVQVGKVSCKGEAQARAVRAKKYMREVRGAPRDRIIWRDIGYADGFEVSFWMAPRGKQPLSVPEYQRATEEHVMKDCGSNPLRQKRRGKS
jgi:hypothetical protein